MIKTTAGLSKLVKLGTDNDEYADINLSNFTILLVDDDTNARNLLRQMLISFGVTDIYDSASGYEALTFLENSYDMVDIILCDWVMPGMDGCDLLRRIRAIDTELPFLMVTGLNDVESVTAARDAGVTSYITKPIDMAKLKTAVFKVAKKLQAA